MCIISQKFLRHIFSFNKCYIFSLYCALCTTLPILNKQRSKLPIIKNFNNDDFNFCNKKTVALKKAQFAGIICM